MSDTESSATDAAPDPGDPLNPSPTSLSAKSVSADELHPETKLKVDSLVEEYEIKLRRQLDLTRPESHITIRRKTRTFRERAIRNELADLQREDEDIRAEEKDLIGFNFWACVTVTAAVVLVALIMGPRLGAAATTVSELITRYLSWFYMLVTSTFLVFLGYLAFSRYGRVVLGDPESRPEFSKISWYSMLFSAGMGVGILFYGSAEPMEHYLDPPIVEPESLEAARAAVAYSVFHWALHAWSVYTVCAASVAYYGFRKRKKYLISSSIVDITHSATSRRLVKSATDLIATLAVTFGVAASLGLGIVQISSGIDYVSGLSTDNFFGYLVIIVAMTATFMVSSSTGLDKGIKILSNINMGAALLLLLFVFLAGPTLFCLKVFVDSIGVYIQNLPELSFKIDPFRTDYEQWMGDWTLGYFTWWIAWSPFVGIFIARISRGRTLRELILGSVLIPAAFSMFWFAVFGGTALHLQRVREIDIGHAMLENISVSTFLVFEQLPLSNITSILTIVLLFTFLVTSADSATFVISMMTSEGNLDPGLKLKLIWGSVLAILSLVLVTGGGMEALQAATLIFAFPFAIVLVAMAISLRFRLSIQMKDPRL